MYFYLEKVHQNYFWDKISYVIFCKLAQITKKPWYFQAGYALFYLKLK